MEAPVDAVLPELEGEEFLMWEARQAERFELHHGFVFAFAGGSAAHAKISLNLQVVLRRAYPSPCSTFGSAFKIEISSTTYYYPDASVFCSPVEDGAVIGRDPVLIGEVLSPSTAAYDRVEKRMAYRSLASLDVYFLVDSTRRRVEVDRMRSGRWQTEVIVEGSFALGEIDCVIDDLYHGTSL